MVGSAEQRTCETVPKQWRRYGLTPAQEETFERETRADRNAQLRFWCWIGLAFHWLTLGIDLLTRLEILPAAILLRVLVSTPVALLSIWLLAGEGPPTRREWAAPMLPSATNHAVIQLLFLLSGRDDALPHLLVMTMATVGTNFFLPTRLRQATALTGAMLLTGSCAAVFATFSGRGNPYAQPFFVIALMMALLSLLGRFCAERQSRRSFLLGAELRVRAEELARANTRLQEISNTDPLTGLANRRSFDAALDEAWRAAAAEDGWIGLFMLDVDHFKAFNDSAGHAEGDQALRSVAAAVRDHVRVGVDIPARYGGEEFVAILPGTSSREAFAAADRVRCAVEALLLPHPGRHLSAYVTASVGVATTRPGRFASATPAMLLRSADAALYAAKAAGRNCVVANVYEMPVT